MIPFLYERDNRYRLSPAYDLNPVPLAVKARELTTWISEEGPGADLDLARNAASYFAPDMARANAIIIEVAMESGRMEGHCAGIPDEYIGPGSP